MSTIESLPAASAVESSVETVEKPVSTTGLADIETLIAANPSQALVILAKYIEKAAKAVGKQPKRKGSMPKGETPKQLNAWADRVTATLERLREENPKATRKEAMEVAARELDEEDPEGAPKRAAAREKRAETASKKKALKEAAKGVAVIGAAITAAPAEKKARKPKDPEAAAAKKAEKAAKKSTSSEDAKAAAASILAKVGLSDAAPEAKPKKTLKKKAAAPEPEVLPAETGLERVEFNGMEYFKNDTGKSTYFWQVNDDGESFGAFVGRFDESTKTIDATYPEPIIASE